MTQAAPLASDQPQPSLKRQVRDAVVWRSGTQILGQMIAWGSTFLVIRILSPSDYGLFAMTQVVLALLAMLDGYALASAVIQRPNVTRHMLRQLFGMLIVLNVALALAQIAVAPLAAAYFRQPMVADLLRVQALLYLTTPFIAFPYALLARAMDFRRQAAVNLASAVVGAVVALAGATAGWGVWTLVAAPFALFTTRAIGMMIAARAWEWPSFDFRGAGAIVRFGGLMAASQLFWFLQSQADVFIAGRVLAPHSLGIYTTSLFLTQILVSKFVPPVNEVAFSAYARIHNDRSAVAGPFLTAVRTIMLVALPAYLGLAVLAEPLVLVALGPKWGDAGGIVATLALAMPFMTLQVLFAPAANALGKPELSLKTGMVGAALLASGFLVGVQWGVHGLALSWLVAYPLYLLVAAWMILPALKVRATELFVAVRTPLLAAAAMAAGLLALRRLLPPLSAPLELLALVPIGAALYGGWLIVFARPLLRETWALVRAR